MRYSTDGMTNLRPWKVPVKVGNAKDIYSEMIGNYHGKVVQKDGSTINIVLEDVIYIPSLYVNLFSLTKVLNNPSIDVRKDKGTLALIFPSKQKMVFDLNISVIGVDIVPNINAHNAATVSYSDLHDKLGHANEAMVRQTAKCYGITVSGKAGICDNCAKAKIKKTKLLKRLTPLQPVLVNELLLTSLQSKKSVMVETSSGY